MLFHRVTMPDGYSVSLDQFKGLNQVGETGLRDQVNHHYAQIFGAWPTRSEPLQGWPRQTRARVPFNRQPTPIARVSPAAFRSLRSAFSTVISTFSQP